MMFTTQTATPAPTLSPSSATVSSPARPSRLRGLSYLRNYTHGHLHSRENAGNASSSLRPSTLTRSTSYPSATSPTNNSQTGSTTPNVRSPTQRATPILQRSTADVLDAAGNSNAPGSTSGWLPTAGATSAVLSGSVETSGGSNMGRTRSGTATREAGSDISQLNGGRDPQLQYGSAPNQPSQMTNGLESKPTIRFSQYQDVRAPRPSLVFSPMGRTLPTGTEVIRVGRYSERETLPNQPANLSTANPVGFKSKVVSRKHCEFWCQAGCWFIKDVKSSSGTFLNHVRLSSPGNESKPFPVKDGDIVQLGIDFKGGEEMIFRCVKIRVELNRAWQSSLNSFNVASHKRLRNMAKQLQSPTSSSSQDCSICLGAVAPCQSLFVAPCSHTWHYKCVRRIINSPQWPTFVCPNCRAVADLEADVDEPINDGQWEDEDAVDDEEISEELPDGNAGSNSVRASVADNGTVALDHSMQKLEIPSSQRSAVDQTTLNTSVGPIDIVRHSRSTSSRHSADGTSGPDNNISPIPRNLRTPSPGSRLLPNGLDILNGSEGPMTPRNDVGPFVFDGGAGHASEAPAPLNLAAPVERAGTPL